MLSKSFLGKCLPRRYSKFESIMNLFKSKITIPENASEQHGYRIVLPGVVQSELSVPENIPKPDYRKAAGRLGRTIVLNDDDKIRYMRQSCTLAAHILKTAAAIIQPGISTNDIDVAVHEETIKCGGYPSTLGYKGFPKSCCTSVNNVVCHGIPDDTVLNEGDIINVDITVFYMGCHGDTSDTFTVGKVDDRAHDMIYSTRECLQAAIGICKPGTKFAKIPEIIEPLANAKGFRVCRRFVGHGIGSIFHMPPEIWHVRSRRADKRSMESGMIFTIEPILMEGDDDIKTLEDGWTVISEDNLRSAQAEHTILITQSGNEILTLAQ